MLTIAGETVPVRLTLRLDPGEEVRGAVHGLLDSGLAITGRRLFGWRAGGTSAPLPLDAIERILIDAGPGSDRIDLVVLTCLAMHPPLVLTQRASELTSSLAFVAEVARLAGRDPDVEHLGPVYRFTFPAVGRGQGQLRANGG